MNAKLPIIAAPFSLGEIVSAFFATKQDPASSRFICELSKMLKRNHLVLTGSGIGAFYTILEMLKTRSNRREIILPAYTAGSLVVACKKANLKVKLADISPKDFGIDKAGLLNSLSKDTLAVVPVHMFGIPISWSAQMRSIIPAEVAVIEDCAQAMGSMIDGRKVGTLSEISFFSFNRGKNLPLFSGGCIATDREDLAPLISKIFNSFVPVGKYPSSIIELANAIALSIAANRLAYGLGYPLISRFKDVTPPSDIAVNRMGVMRCELGMRLVSVAEKIFAFRYENGKRLAAALEGCKICMAPAIPSGSFPAFNRFPILFERVEDVDRAIVALWKAGIESSRMYSVPLHEMFDLGYKGEEFPIASSCAGRILTLPVHPGVRERDLSIMVKAIKAL